MRMITKALGICLSLCISVSMHAQCDTSRILYYEEADQHVFEQYITYMKQEGITHMDSLMIRSARFFLEIPYVASTLEKEPEGLVINLREMDCTTFVENVLALSRTLQGMDPSFNAFCDTLQSLRYRNGLIHDYTDRLHYMADWLYENERKKIIHNITQEIGGIPLTLDLSFISTHPDSYKQLKERPEWISKIAEKEKEINQRPHYYLPKEAIDQYASDIEDGDILCFVTRIKGLDVTHVGIAYWQGNQLTFIHASSSAEKVIIQTSSLKEYMEGMKNCRGIWVARPLDLLK